ncbi:MAG: AtpZ/AtpI family protein [Elusimicrobia bacterium]|nr:AtpZ/AtpI family protein [Elusimicrobiota bacterium]
MEKNGKNYFKHVQIGIELAGFIIIGVFGGYAADRRFGTLPWLTLAGSFLGIGIGFYLVLRRLLKNSDD